MTAVAMAINNKIRGAFSIFCPFAFKARSITLIFVECITFHQTSLIDDVHKISAVFTGHRLCFWYVFNYTPHILKYSRSDLTLTLKLPAWKSFLWLRKKIRNPWVQDSVSIWCVAARKLSLVVDRQVKIWACTCTLSYKNCHTFMISTPFWYHFDNICEV